ncbi:MAG: MFS transporter [Prevotella sp.]
MKSKRISPWAWVPTLYFAEGLPYVTVMVISMVMYKRLGLSNEDITLYTSWLYLPWVIKPFWSPFVDVLKSKRWWILAMQMLVGAALGGVAFTIPTSQWLQGTLCFFWLMAFSSATHDIAADGFYMLGLNHHQQATFVGIRSTFYRIATIFGQGLLIMLAGNLEVVTRNVRYSWSLMFYFMLGIFIILWLFHHAVLPRPVEDSEHSHSTLREVFDDLWHTFATFFRKPQVWVGICFLLLYRMPEGLLVKISPLFLIDSVRKGGLGLSPAELGFVQGTVGVVGLTIGGILGGLAAGRHGLKHWLWPMVCAITLPDLVYVYLSYALPESLSVINICVFVEQFGYGFGFTAYMLYMVYFSQGEHKTSHFALCTAFMALSMMLPGMVAGFLQQQLGYQGFFILVVITCLVTFFVTSFVRIDDQFGKKTGDGDEQ